jgi:anti-anti-sigma factor
MNEWKRVEISSRVVTDGIVVVKVWGILDVFSFQDLKKYIEELAKAAGARIVVNLSEVEYMASAGWSVLLSKRQTIKHGGGELSIFGMNESLRRVYDTMKIEKMLPSAVDENGALSLVKPA